MGLKKGHDIAITKASKKYEESVKMFTEVENKIDEVTTELTATINKIDSEIAELQTQRNQALADKARYDVFKTKIKEFTA